MKKGLSILMLSMMFSPINILAYSEKVIPGGENIGINIQSKGLIVVGFYKINGDYYGEENFKVGDRILKIEEDSVESVRDMTERIKSLNKEEINITYIRNNKTISKNIKLKKEDGIYKTGLYIKDGVNGIGTVTYIDPETKIYGALGHEVIESNTRKSINLKSGNIFDSIVTSIDRSQNGTPGSKNATINYNDLLGNIKKNSTVGIYGNYDNIPSKNPIDVAKFEEIQKGKAHIYTTVNNKEVKKYEIDIKNIDKTNKNTTKAISFTVTDKKLLDDTGGIVQGMSGSPIIQDGKIIGAVTHVIVDDVKNGYGIFIRTMLKEGES